MLVERFYHAWPDDISRQIVGRKVTPYHQLSVHHDDDGLLVFEHTHSANIERDYGWGHPIEHAQFDAFEVARDMVTSTLMRTETARALNREAAITSLGAWISCYRTLPLPRLVR